jgi:hypothetical protein
VTQDENFPRAAAAARHNLDDAMAFPILIGEEFHGVMGLFNTAALESDPDFKKLFSDIMLQVSRCLGIDNERRCTENTVALREK